MPRRYPRPEKRFPRTLTSDDVKSATNKNGSVDLNKIRATIDRRSEERKKMAQKALETKRENDEQFKSFMSAYDGYMNAKFIPNTKERFVSYNSNGKRIARRYKTDRSRFIDFYTKMKKRYGGSKNWGEKWAKYVDKAFHLALEEYGFSKQTQIFGVIISEKVAEKVFADLRREERREERKKHRMTQKERHERLFNRHE